jgi:hypothetical protein
VATISTWGPNLSCGEPGHYRVCPIYFPAPPFIHSTSIILSKLKLLSSVFDTGLNERHVQFAFFPSSAYNSRPQWSFSITLQCRPTPGPSQGDSSTSRHYGSSLLFKHTSFTLLYYLPHGCLEEILSCLPRLQSIPSLDIQPGPRRFSAVNCLPPQLPLD